MRKFVLTPEAGLDFSDLVLGTLIVVAVAPLILVGVLALAHVFDWPMPERLLAATHRALQLQWLVGGVVNAMLGLAMIAGGAWLAGRATTPLTWLTVPAMVAFGLWRLRRGVGVLRDFKK